MEFKCSDRMSSLKPSTIREMLKYTSDPTVISLAGGNPSPELFPAKELEAVAADILKNDASLALQYGITEGYPPLVNQIRERMKTKYGIDTPGDEIIVVHGGQQVIDLVTKCIVNEGDTVISENPSFIGALNTFRSFRANIVGIPMDYEGMRIDYLEKALQTEKNVKLIYTIPTFQNPMGVTMSLERRKKLYELAVKYNVPILEDSPYFELSYSGEIMPPIKTLDKTGHIIYAGSFSKIVSPGIRLGYAIGPAELISKMTVAKQGEDVCTNQFIMVAISKYLERYDLDAHIKECCEVYSKKRNFMVECIDKYFDKRVTRTNPGGGIFIWCDLPEGYSGTDLWKFALTKKVACVPGATFDVNSDPTNRGFRLNFSLPSLEEIENGCRILGECLKEFLK